MTVLDRQNLEKILAAQMEFTSEYYSDDDFISIGNLTNTQFILIGSLSRLNTEYLLELSIADPVTGERIASYPPTNCSYDELASLAVIKDASEELLTQIGVTLTDNGKKTLHTINKSTANAETALSKGIIAQRKNTVVEALSYYYDAVSFEPSLPEAKDRLSVISAEITSGNIGQSVRNEIEARRSWANILDECAVFYNSHLPFEIIYNPELSQGKIDFNSETVDLSFMLKIVPSTGFKVIEDVFEGLGNTGKKNAWGFDAWPFSIESGIQNHYNVSDDFKDIRSDRPGREYIYTYYKRIPIKIELLNESGKIIGNITINANIEMGTAKALKLGTSKLSYHDLTDAIVYNPIIHPKTSVCEIHFGNINANDITDTLTIKILSVNGIGAEMSENGSNIKISTGTVNKPLIGSYHVFNRNR
jgi:hypothetical protein